MKVWQHAHGLVLEMYRYTSEFPRGEQFGVAEQLRRAAYSVTANIVEGQSRNTTKEYMQFLYNARGSVEEARYFLMLSKDLGYLKEQVFAELESRYEHVSRLLNGLIKSLKGRK
ncbi:MAG TPA: four helix bundle protein [Nitrospiria bacterium]|nr:four helix bundle protein [Nitrospiria bacterium]